LRFDKVPKQRDKVDAEVPLAEGGDRRARLSGAASSGGEGSARVSAPVD
jgi:hypothetical protein